MLEGLTVAEMLLFGKLWAINDMLRLTPQPLEELEEPTNMVLCESHNLTKPLSGAHSAFGSGHASSQALESLRRRGLCPSRRDYRRSRLLASVG